MNFSRSLSSIAAKMPTKFPSVNPAWKSNDIHYKMWDEITYPFPNFHGTATEVWKWVSNFIPYFTGHVIICPCWDLSQSILVKKTSDLHMSSKNLSEI